MANTWRAKHFKAQFFNRSNRPRSVSPLSSSTGLPGHGQYHHVPYSRSPPADALRVAVPFAQSGLSCRPPAPRRHRGIVRFLHKTLDGWRTRSKFKHGQLRRPAANFCTSDEPFISFVPILSVQLRKEWLPGST